MQFDGFSKGDAGMSYEFLCGPCDGSLRPLGVLVLLWRQLRAIGDYSGWPRVMWGWLAVRRRVGCLSWPIC